MKARALPRDPVVTGPARLGPRTKLLTPHLQPGDVAVINHEDLDRVAAEGLVEANPAAIVNAARSISGKYPNVGPLLIAAAGIPLVDAVGEEVMTRLHDGSVLRIDDGDVFANGERIASGTRQTLQSLEAEYEAAKVTVGEELERFAENTLEFMRRERQLLFETPALPDLKVDMRNRQAIVVVRGADYRSDLATLGEYIREMRPVVIAVDGGADALRDQGHRPDLIVGDFDSVSDASLRSGAQLIVHAYPDGRAPGAERLEALGLSYSTIAFAGTSEDVALLLAYEKGAELIVAVGLHGSMVDFLDKGRPGMASTFLVRLKVGPILMDAKGVSKLYERRLRKRDIALFLLAVAVAFLVAGYTVRDFLAEVLRSLLP
ncbi:MAG TPA: putative cytokinetic ring protein SteA [Acidimicrobiales bacterium]|nr:putative cytokinetic ring protein SteA [Acidimicrobiales bacterium]